VAALRGGGAGGRRGLEEGGGEGEGLGDVGLEGGREGGHRGRERGGERVMWSGKKVGEGRGSARRQNMKHRYHIWRVWVRIAKLGEKEQ